MEQAVSRQPLSAGARVRSLVTPHGTCSELIGHEHFIPSPSLFPSQCHSPYSCIHLFIYHRHHPISVTDSIVK